MALFSDVDWLVILGVAAFLLFGAPGRDFARQIGRLYARAARFRQEMVGEIVGSVGLPTGTPLTSSGLRAALVGDAAAPSPAGAAAEAPSMVPPATAYPGILTQVAPLSVRTVETLACGAAMGPGMWSVATTSAPGEVVRLR
jgi:hypothetical protein